MLISAFRKQSGFAVIETLLMLVVLAIVGFTGYYVWHSQQQTDKALNTANDTAQHSTFTKPKTTNSQKYLHIKEWNVELPLTADLSDAYYRYDSSIDTVYLSKSMYKQTDCAADKTTLGALGRFTGDEGAEYEDGSPAPGLMTAQFPDAVHVGNYFYRYVHPQAGCDFTDLSSGNPNADPGATKASQYMTDFANAAAKITASN